MPSFCSRYSTTTTLKYKPIRFPKHGHRKHHRPMQSFISTFPAQRPLNFQAPAKPARHSSSPRNLSPYRPLAIADSSTSPRASKPGQHW
ncbi:hypothetical protein BJX68DRAFT_125512 [Aspergillus pseudodeflectus]|uniref:Uncharacterized protein n=1 Tax=Aspergillus pseudodeflectus TaxID=176178 RepID=A0ABR4K373_9EURO